ncbi:MAG: nitrogen fixation protein NifX [Azospirillum sp.]|nr:nitrogen fixation protein NifX [Azospirillum sp.]
MRVAFCTEDMKHVDAHFGWARNLVIFEVDKAGHRLIEAVQFGGEMSEDGNEDKLVAKLDAIVGCSIVYVAAIGPSAAARIVNRKIHPVKVAKPEAITDLLDRLVSTLNGAPPPWLRKAMNPTAKPNFADDEED